MSTLFTSESVCAGHPDKVADQISDAILDAVIKQDPQGRVAVETAVTKNRVILLGELTTRATVDYSAIVRRTLRRLGYTKPEWGFAADTVQVDNYLARQSAEIAAGVDQNGAGDQGMMFGYACTDTPECMPLPIMLAHALTQALDKAHDQLPYLRPDGKAQVTIRYEKDRPAALEHVTLAKPHDNTVPLNQVKHDLWQTVIKPTIEQYGLLASPETMVLNGTGVWHSPGPASDAGLTGRKIIVDGYGGYARVGGGAFSGKDPTKVDRSGAYAARYLAKNLVAAGLASRAEVSLAYVIGAQQPVMKHIETFGTATAKPSKLQGFVDELLDTSVTGIIEGLELRRPIYETTASYGHFGRTSFPWEQLCSNRAKPLPSSV